MDIQAHFTDIQTIIAADLNGASQSIEAAVAWLTDPVLFEALLKDTIMCKQIDAIMAKRPDLKPGSINRYLATVRAILRKAHREWGWLDAVPTLRMREEPRRRVCWITPDEAVPCCKPYRPTSTPWPNSP